MKFRQVSHSSSLCCAHSCVTLQLRHGSSPAVAPHIAHLGPSSFFLAVLSFFLWSSLAHEGSTTGLVSLQGQVKKIKQIGGQGIPYRALPR